MAQNEDDLVWAAAVRTAADSGRAALADEVGCDLLTADQRLASATGPRCVIRVLR